MQLGTHKDGGTWNATPGVSFVEFRSDIGNLYAVKDFADASGRRVMWGWVTASPACISLPREITYHPRLKQLVFSPVCTQTSLLRLRSDLSRLAVGGRYPSCPSCGRPRRWRNLRLSSSRGTPLTTSAPAGPQGRAMLARLPCPSECPPSRHAAAYESWETAREMLARWMCGWSSSRRATAAKPAGPSASGVSDPPAFASEFLPRLADRPFFSVQSITCRRPILRRGRCTISCSCFPRTTRSPCRSSPTERTSRHSSCASRLLHTFSCTDDDPESCARERMD